LDGGERIAGLLWPPPAARVKERIPGWVVILTLSKSGQLNLQNRTIINGANFIEVDNGLLDN